MVLTLSTLSLVAAVVGANIVWLDRALVLRTARRS